MADQLHQRPLSNTELSLFSEQLAVTLSAGIPAAEGIRILLEEADSKQEKELLSLITEHLDLGESLYDSLKAAGLFPEYMINMTRLGEETGTLDEVMATLSLHYEREENIKRSIKNAVIYPAVMAGMMLAVIIVLIVMVMPLFSQVYIQLGSELSGIPKLLLDIGSVISDHAVLIFVAVVLIIVLVFWLLHSETGSRIRMALAYKTGVTGKMFDDAAALRFADGMAIGLRSGLDENVCLELAGSLNDNPYFQKKLDACKEKTQDGEELASAMFSSGIFSGSYARMITIGAKSGSLDIVMERIADLYQDSIDSRLESSLSKIEPTLVVVLSLAVGCILLSVMLPLMGLMASI